MSKDDQGGGTRPGRRARSGWDLPMSGKTGTTEAHRSSAFLGFTNSSPPPTTSTTTRPTPGELCSFPLRQCGSRQPVRRQRARPDLVHRDEADRQQLRRRQRCRRPIPRYVDGGARLEGAQRLGHGPGTGAAAAEGRRLPGRRPGDHRQQRLVLRHGRRHIAVGADGPWLDHHASRSATASRRHRLHRRSCRRRQRSAGCRRIWGRRSWRSPVCRRSPCRCWLPPPPPPP